MKTTIVGNYEDFAAASRVAAQLMIAGFAQAEISVVGREQVSDGARFAFAGALAQDLSGARDEDFERRLVSGLARLCVPPRAAARHAAIVGQQGGLVAIHAECARARRAESVMAREGAAESYVAGAPSLGRNGGARAAIPRSAVALSY